jgi:uncharacterized protein (TIGR03083 family)
MADLPDVYDSTRKDITAFVSSLSDADLNRRVPATPDWTIKDIVAHLSGDVAYVNAGDFPREFFAAFGEPAGVVKLNEWTSKMVAERSSMTLNEIIEEWETGTSELLEGWRSGIMPHDLPIFAANVLVTDIAVHQQDIYGALGLERDRDSAALRIGTTGYIVSMSWRLQPAGIPPLLFDLGDKTRATSEGEPGATVRATRFEFFRALSGRRTPDQIRNFEWQGDPEPYIPYFFPYGMREEALVE